MEYVLYKENNSVSPLLLSDPSSIDGVEEDLLSCVRSRAKEIYGDPLPALVKKRIEGELRSITENGYTVVYSIAKRLAEDSKMHGYHIGSHGAVGSSLVAFLAGITEVNPLPPHYVCPACVYTEFVVDGAASGFDLPATPCPVCGATMKGEGQDIPFETFAGFYSEKVPSIGMDFARKYQSSAKDCLRSILGKDRVFFADVNATPYENVARYCIVMNMSAHASFDMLHSLEKSTGVKAVDIPLNDPNVYRLCTSLDALGVTAEEIEYETDSLSPSEFVQQLLDSCHPRCFFDLVKIYGLAHGTAVWFGNAENLISNGVCSLTDVAALREDIMHYLMGKGLDKKTAFRIMEMTRKGKARRMLDDKLIGEMLAHSVPKWYIESLKKIQYMYPKAHAVAHMINEIRLSWYKLRYPKEYKEAFVLMNESDDLQ